MPKERPCALKEVFRIREFGTVVKAKVDMIFKDADVTGTTRAGGPMSIA